MTVGENVELPLLLLPMSSAERHKRILVALEAVSLLDRADQALYLAKRRGRNQLAVLDAGNDGAMAAAP